ncbi:MAG: rhomboid family intramembrane serine protease [Armatimonadaceae bacterium]
MIPLRDDNPTRIVPFVTYLIIAANLVIFLMEITGGIVEAPDRLAGSMAGWTMIPAELTQGRDYAINGETLRPFWLTIFTSMFMHGGWLHFLGNMLYLYIFGNNIEDCLGHVKFIVFYLVCGLIAALSQIFFKTDSVIPTLGASGAIAGVLGAYLVLFPTARVNTLVFLGIFITSFRVPAFVLLGFWIVSQFFSQWTESLKMQVTGEETGGVAYLAHIGGFIAGAILIKLFGGKPCPPDQARYFPRRVEPHYITRYRDYR